MALSGFCQLAWSLIFSPTSLIPRIARKIGVEVFLDQLELSRHLICIVSKGS